MLTQNEIALNYNKDMNIQKYLHVLEEEGWSELIDERWKEEVKQLLTKKFPEMTAEEWDKIAHVVFL